MFATPPSEEKRPVVYLIFGDDRFAMQKFTKEMLSRISNDPTTAEMNSAQLDGSRVQVDAVRSAAFALPFLSSRRVVVLNQPHQMAKNQKVQEQFIDVLEKLPESTALVLVVETEPEKKDWKGFSSKHWLRQWVKNQSPEKVYVKEYVLPNQYVMPQWIMDETARQKGKILKVAAVELANFVGTNTQLASLEIDKLLTYVNFSRPIEVEDVKDLVADVSPINVFDMVDAMAEGKTQLALKYLHGLLEEQDPFSLFGMIVRQFRLLVLARQVMDNGGRKGQITKELHIHPFVAEKLEKQGRRFSFEDLQEIYRQLLIIDENIKTSQMEPNLALDLFVSMLSTT